MRDRWQHRLRSLLVRPAARVVLVLALLLGAGGVALAALHTPAQQHRTTSAARSQDPTTAATPATRSPQPRGVSRSRTAHPKPRQHPAVAQIVKEPDMVVAGAAGIRAPVVPIAMDRSGALDPPGDVNTAGLWNQSAAPGATVGQTLLTAHTVHTGGGAFSGLGRLRPGDPVVVTTSDRRVSYAVDQVLVLSKSQLAAKSQDLFGQDVHDGRLVLVTCSNWNGSEFLDNTVVLAQPTSVVPLDAA